MVNFRANQCLRRRWALPALELAVLVRFLSLGVRGLSAKPLRCGRSIIASDSRIDDEDSVSSFVRAVDTKSSLCD